MMLTVEMQPGQNIVDLGNALTQKVAEVKEILPSDVQVSTIVDQPEVVDMNLGHFFIEFGIAIAAVILVVMLLLPFRVATISAIAAPVTIAVTFAILNLLGIEMHQVSLAAMIIVLGMVVDDAIIVVDNYIEKVDEKIPSWTAAWQSATAAAPAERNASCAEAVAAMRRQRTEHTRRAVCGARVGSAWGR